MLIFTKLTTNITDDNLTPPGCHEDINSYHPLQTGNIPRLWSSCCLASVGMAQTWPSKLSNQPQAMSQGGTPRHCWSWKCLLTSLCICEQRVRQNRREIFLSPQLLQEPRIQPHAVQHGGESPEGDEEYRQCWREERRGPHRLRSHLGTSCLFRRNSYTAGVICRL